MNELDDRIRQTLNDKVGGQNLVSHEPGLFAQVAETMRGRSRWLTIMVWIETFAFAGLSIYGVYMFFQSESTKELIAYGALFLFAIQVTMMLKLWNWMLLNRNAVLREVKRTELLIATLINANDR